MLLDNGKFLTELHKLYDSNKAKGSVWVTLKRSECTAGPGHRLGAAAAGPAAMPLPILPASVATPPPTPSPRLP